LGEIVFILRDVSSLSINLIKKEKLFQAEFTEIQRMATLKASSSIEECKIDDSIPQEERKGAVEKSDEEANFYKVIKEGLVLQLVEQKIKSIEDYKKTLDLLSTYLTPTIK
jgi:hypothetical protein